MINDQQEPLVSVWIVTYNHAAFIRQCLESVMSQKTTFPFEVIIGEDCSPDGTRAIIQEFEAAYPHIIKPIYHNTNVGAYRNAYEFCYPRLKGKYVACLEGDDYWTDENKLQMQVDALERDQDAVLCFTRVGELKDAESVIREHWSTSYNRLKNRYTVEDILKKFNIVTCTIMFRHIYPVLPYNVAKFPTGDVSLCTFLMLEGDAIYIDKEMAVYRLHNNGIYSSTGLESRNLVFLKLFEQFMAEPLMKPYMPLLKVLYADRAYQSLCFEIKKPEPDKQKVSEYYRLAIKHANYHNVYYPLKTLLRKLLFDVTGKGFGRKL